MALPNSANTYRFSVNLVVRSYGIAFMSIGTFLLVINAILAASIPVLIYHIGTKTNNSGMLLFNYGTCEWLTNILEWNRPHCSSCAAVNSNRVYTVSVNRNVVSVTGRYANLMPGHASSCALAAHLCCVRCRNFNDTTFQALSKRLAKRYADDRLSLPERYPSVPPANGEPTDEILCLMRYNDGDENYLFRSALSWTLLDPNGRLFSLHSISVLAHRFVLSWHRRNIVGQLYNRDN